MDASSFPLCLDTDMLCRAGDREAPKYVGRGGKGVSNHVTNLHAGAGIDTTDRQKGGQDMRPVAV